jgi:hypothetical protein
MMWGLWALIWAIGGCPIIEVVRYRLKRREWAKTLGSRDRVDDRDDAWEIERRREQLRGFYFAKSIIRILAFALVGFAQIMAFTPDYPMMWTFIAMFLVFGIAELASQRPRFRPRYVLGFFLIVLVLAPVFSFAPVLLENANAIYFDKFITRAEGFPIQSETPDNLLRLTTKELATTIAQQHMGELGGSLEVVDAQVTLYEGRLTWAVLVSRLEQWKEKYRVVGLVFIDANSPDKPPKIVQQEFAISEGLGFNPLPWVNAWGNVGAKGYFGIDTAITVGDSYPVFAPDGRWYMAVTSYRVDWNFVRKYDGVYLLDQNGKVVNKYESDLPEWLIQPYDEQVFLEGGIEMWGGHRRGGSFDPFAGGLLWIPPSTDRLRLSEDVRYIYDPDLKQVVALANVHYIREAGELSLAGTFKITSKGISFYDLKDYNMISGFSAGKIVQSKITARAGTELYTAMELLYPVKVGGTTRYAWFVPIYYQAGGVTGLAGLGIVDSQAKENCVVEYTGEGLTGEALIAKAKESFRVLYGAVEKPKDITTIEGTLVSKHEFVEAGNTRILLTIKTSKGDVDVLVKVELLSDSEVAKILKAYVGSELTVEVDKDSVVRKVA